MAKTVVKYLCILSTRVRNSIGRFKTFGAGQVYDREEIPYGGCERKEKKNKKGTVIGHEPPVPSPVYFKPAIVGLDMADTAKPTPKKIKKPKEVTPDAD